VITTEEKIFSAQSDGALDVFRQIVIPVQVAIVQASYNIIPFGIGICNGLACQRTWTVFNPFCLHPYLHCLHDWPGQFPALCLSFIVRQAGLIAAMLNPVYMLYLGQSMFGHLPVFIKCLFKMPADMYQTIEQPHVGIGLEGCFIACKTVALKITLEVILICQGFDDRSGPRSFIVMEDDQFLHDRPYHPEIFLVGPVLFPVDDRNGSLVRLYIVIGEDFPFEFFIQRFKQFHSFLEPSVQRTFGQAFHSKMAVLLYLTVERDMIFIFLKQYLGKQTGVSDTFVNGHQRHGSYLYAFLSSRRKQGAVLERIFGTDDYLDIKHTRFVFDDFGYLFANFTVQGQVHTGRFYNFGFEYGQLLQHFAVLTLLLPDFCRFLFNLLHSLVPFFFRLLPESGKLIGKQVGYIGVIYAELLRFTPKELTVQPCDLSRQLFDTFLQIPNLFRLIFIGGRQ